ncbi:MAG: hypothetical protein CMP14_07480 [Rickettsiales bacterium]|nr:hypothetical protein [Rickettsiales bacterium]
MDTIYPHPAATIFISRSIYAFPDDTLRRKLAWLSHSYLKHQIVNLSGAFGAPAENKKTKHSTHINGRVF